MQTSPGTTHFFLSIYLPHLSCMIPYSYWALACDAVLPSCITFMRFLFVRPEICPSVKSFSNIRLPSDSTSRWTPLPSANSSYCHVCSGLSPPSCNACRAHIQKETTTFFRKLSFLFGGSGGIPRLRASRGSGLTAHWAVIQHLAVRIPPLFQKEKQPFGLLSFLAEAVGFEPTSACTLPDFESGPL